MHIIWYQWTRYDRKQIEDLLWTATRTRGGGRQKIQEEEKGSSGSISHSIKWSMLGHGNDMEIKI